MRSVLSSTVLLQAKHGDYASLVCCAVAVVAILIPPTSRADSINSPNITMNVDTNRSTGAGAGNISVIVNTITVAETNVNEYSSAASRAITFQVRPGFQLDSSSSVTALSTTMGFNGEAVNTAASVTPTGAADEVITFLLTSGTSTNQDIIRFNGIKLKILNAAGAAGPAQTTMSVTTSTAGGAFTDQGIVAVSITKGVADRLVFSAQPGSTQSVTDLLPAVKIVDFGGNLVTADQRTITLAIQENPVATALLGTVQRQTDGGVASWVDADDLQIATAAAGFTLRATHHGAAFLSSDFVDSNPFEITAGPPDHLVFSLQPVDTVAGGDILLAVTVKDLAENTVTAPPANVTIDSAVNPGGWPLLVNTGLTKATVAGVAAWDATDRLRIHKSIPDYRLLASGVGAPIQSGSFDITAATPNLLRFVQQPTQTQEDSSVIPPVSIEILDGFANRTSSTANVALALESPCDGALSGGSVAAATGLATFDALRIDTPCSNIALEAASDGLTRINSEPFVVTALPPVALRFVQQPTTVEEGVAVNPPVSVEIIDATGNRTDSAATVQMSLTSSCGGLLSTTSAAAVGGLATFAVLSIDTPCAAASLQASAAGLAGTTSGTFAVTETRAVDDLDGAACGACGQGGAIAMAPVLFMLIGLKHRRSIRRA